MKLHTIQLGKWRTAKKKGIELIDVTLKSGDTRFSPDKETLYSYKGSKQIVDDQAVYCVRFRELMNKSYRENPEAWEEMCRKEEVAIACYCKAGAFCHRVILVEYFEKVCKKLGIEFEYMGELK